MHLRGTFGKVAFSRIGSTPPQATSSWMSFLAPIGVTMLIIVPVSAALLSSGVEPVDRDEVENSSGFRHREDVEPGRPSSETGNFATAVPDAPRESASRRRGFSPVVRGDEEQGSSSEDDDEDDYDDDDDDYDEERPRRRLTEDEKTEAWRVLEKMPPDLAKRPFMAPFARAVQRRKELSESQAATIAEPSAGEKEARAPTDEASPPGAGGAKSL